MSSLHLPPMRVPSGNTNWAIRSSLFLGCHRQSPDELPRIAQPTMTRLWRLQSGVKTDAIDGKAGCLNRMHADLVVSASG